jgi:RNA polymerase sigma-54 factor
MKPSLQLRIGQHLALTPQLQQSLKLLQMSTLELSQEIEQFLVENPLLERLDDPLNSAMSISGSGGLASRDAAQFPDEFGRINGAGDAASEGASTGEFSGTEVGGSSTESGATGELGDFEANYDGEGTADYGQDWSSDTPGKPRDDDQDDKDYAQMAGAQASLRDFLMSQVAATQCSLRDRGLMAYLIDELSPDGYLHTSLDEMLTVLPEELEFELSELNAALRIIQSFDPLGVGARDVRECLLLQLQASALPAGDGALNLAFKLVSDHLELLAAKDFVKLRRLLHCEDAELKAAQALVVGLNPRPGAQYASMEATYVVPDVVVKRKKNVWTVELNRGVMPKLKVNSLYAQILKKNRGQHADLGAQLQEARWLIKNVEQRFDTILRVSQAIVDRQKAFFSHGAVAMRPLVLREIAEMLELHESTVSRVTTQKYMLTPNGTFELKYFFGSHVATDSGGAASSTAIRAVIQQLIEAEAPTHPMSDSEIAELLAKQGFVVARRTVAKYREALKIPPVAQRKVL